MIFYRMIFIDKLGTTLQYDFQAENTPNDENIVRCCDAEAKRHYNHLRVYAYRECKDYRLYRYTGTQNPTSPGWELIAANEA